jgi:hypothetical protein
MKKNLEKNRVFILKTTLVFLFFSSFISSSCITTPLSFDSLYPKTWYQKTLDSCICIWQILENLDTNNKQDKMLMCDIMLGKLIFAQCCMEKMREEDNRILLKDYDYLFYVREKIKDLLKRMVVTEDIKDIILFCKKILNERTYQSQFFRKE